MAVFRAAAHLKRSIFILLPIGGPDLPLDDASSFFATEWIKESDRSDDSEPAVDLKSEDINSGGAGGSDIDIDSHVVSHTILFVSQMLGPILILSI